jgi:hypothetical protein
VVLYVALLVVLLLPPDHRYDALGEPGYEVEIKFVSSVTLFGEHITLGLAFVKVGIVGLS